MSKHVREKCGKLCIFSILSSKRGITPTNINANWRHSNLICSTVKKKVRCKISAQFVKACRRKVRKMGGRRPDGRRVGRRVGRTDGRTDGDPEGDPDGHHHTIIRPVWRRAYKNICNLRQMHVVRTYELSTFCWVNMYTPLKSVVSSTMTINQFFRVLQIHVYLFNEYLGELYFITFIDMKRQEIHMHSSECCHYIYM